MADERSTVLFLVHNDIVYYTSNIQGEYNAKFYTYPNNTYEIKLHHGDDIVFQSHVGGKNGWKLKVVNDISDRECVI